MIENLEINKENRKWICIQIGRKVRNRIREKTQEKEGKSKKKL